MLQHPSVSQPRPLGRGDGIKSQIQKKSAGCLIILPHLSPVPRDGAIVSNPKSKKKISRMPYHPSTSQPLPSGRGDSIESQIQKKISRMPYHPSTSQPRPSGRGDSIESQIQKKSAECFSILPYLSPVPWDGAMVCIESQIQKKSAECFSILPYLSPVPWDGAMRRNVHPRPIHENSHCLYYPIHPTDSKIMRKICLILFSFFTTFRIMLKFFKIDLHFKLIRENRR